MVHILRKWKKAAAKNKKKDLARFFGKNGIARKPAQKVAQEGPGGSDN